MNVLIVDDETDLLELCVDAFEMYDHTATGFTSAVDALKVLEDGKFDAIISDSNMPEMKGEEFFKQAKEMMGESLPPFLLATGAIEATDKSVMDLGMSGLIPKPFDISELIEKVESVIKA